MKPSAWASVAISVAVHGLLIVAAARGSTRGMAAAPAPRAVAGIDARAVRGVVAAIDAREQRARLVQQAREDVSAGKLRLGRFLIEAARLDAMESGAELDATRASALFEHRLRALKDAVASSAIEQAVPRVFGDLRYYGRPGGFMPEALISGGGSCEQLSLLIASASHDAGHGEVALRFYGAPGPNGVAHVAPVVHEGVHEHDLVAGRAAHRGGIRIASEELVEIYARAHGLAPSLPHAQGGDAQEEEDSRPTLIAGFPPNRDAYPGRLPLFATQAVRGPADAEAEVPDARDVDPLQDARRCGYYVRMAVLDPMVVQAWDQESGVALDLEPRRTPHVARLETESLLLGNAAHVAADTASRSADRLMAHACVAALGELSSMDFALASEPELARQSAGQAKAARKSGSALARAYASMSEPERARIRGDLGEHAGRTWLLLLLDGGDEIVIDLVEHAEARGWGKISSLAGLMVWKSTRAKALAMVERYPLDDQVDVMHEMYHVHDHMAPWGSDFDLDMERAGASSSFLRGWKVFRGLAWRIWNGRRPVEEMLAALQKETSQAGLGQAWEAAFLEYTARNVLGLLAMRSPELEPVRLLRRAAERNGHASTLSLVRRLAYIESQGELSAPTLADAWQMK